eukprot:jgi/Psemu1/11500/gm1.11500_g
MVFNITTLEENKKNYSGLDYRRALKATKFQNTINLTTKELASLVDNKLIPNYPVTCTNLIVANGIFSKSLATLKGHTTCHAEEHVRPPEITLMPPAMMDQYSNVEIGAEMMFMNGIWFFINISRHIQFATVETISNAKAGMLTSCINNVRQTYAKRGFTVINAAMDKQFEPVRHQLEEISITPNYATRDEHCTLPFRKLPGQMTIKLVTSQVFWWNTIPNKVSRISTIMSSRTIVTRMTLDYKKHMQLQFGEYVQTHEPTDNSTLHKGAVDTSSTVCRQVESLPRVHNMAGGAPLRSEFKNRHGNPITKEHPNDAPLLNEDDRSESDDSSAKDNNSKEIDNDEDAKVADNDDIDDDDELVTNDNNGPGNKVPPDLEDDNEAPPLEQPSHRYDLQRNQKTTGYANATRSKLLARAHVAKATSDNCHATPRDPSQTLFSEN